MYHEIADAMEMMFFAAAAKSDANEEQAKILKAEASARIEAYRNSGDGEAFKGWIQSVMGPNWKPSEDYKRSKVV